MSLALKKTPLTTIVGIVLLELDCVVIAKIIFPVLTASCRETTKWACEKIIDKQMSFEPEPPSRDNTGFAVAATVLISGGVIVIFVLTREIVSKATARQLQQEILLFAAAARRHLDVARERVTTQSDDNDDDTFRPTVTENAPLDYNNISTIRFIDLLAALDDETQQEHQLREILIQNGESPTGLDDLNEASAHLERNGEHYTTNEESEQVVPHNDNQNAISPHRLQVDIHPQEGMENDINDEEFYLPYSQEQQR